jgi:hypothetical protein
VFQLPPFHFHNHTRYSQPFMARLVQYSPEEDPIQEEQKPSFYETFRTNLQDCALDVRANNDSDEDPIKNKQRYCSAYLQGGETTKMEIEQIRTELTDMVLQTSKNTSPHTLQQLITVVINKTETNKYTITICSNWQDAIRVIDTKSSEVFIVSTDSIFSAPDQICHRMHSFVRDITPKNSN